MAMTESTGTQSDSARKAHRARFLTIHRASFLSVLAIALATGPWGLRGFLADSLGIVSIVMAIVGMVCLGAYHRKRGPSC